jgi:hypothetical protein
MCSPPWVRVMAGRAGTLRVLARSGIKLVLEDALDDIASSRIARTNPDTQIWTDLTSSDTAKSSWISRRRRRRRAVERDQVSQSIGMPSWRCAWGSKTSMLILAVDSRFWGIWNGISSRGARARGVVASAAHRRSLSANSTKNVRM